MNKNNRPASFASLLAILLLFFGLSWSAQAYQPEEPEKGKSGKTPITQRDYDNTKIEMADAWHENGKIYVVVATLATLFAGLGLYLFLLDRRITKLEEEVKG